MKKIFLITILFLPFVTFLLNFNVVLAQPAEGSANKIIPEGSANKPDSPAVSNPISTQRLQNPLNAKSVEEVIFLAVDIAIYIGVAFAILAIIWVGFKFILAQGNSEKLKEAREYFMWIIIGLAVLISARVIVEIVQNTLVKSGVVSERAFKP